MKTYIVANWKMNLTVGEASIYFDKIQQLIKPARDLDIIIAPPLIALQPLSLQLNRHKLHLAAQNFYFRDFGAYTGETSITQIKNLADYAIIGHSERRHIFRESYQEVRQKVAAAVRHGITPILCIGETAAERDFNETTDVIRDQLLGGLSEVSAEDIEKVIIAYEPVWAISSVRGARNATPEAVAGSVDTIHRQLVNIYGRKIAKDLPVLYGGSVSPSNAGAYLTIPGVNGLLVGGASLIAEQFNAIIDIAKRVRE